MGGGGEVTFSTGDCSWVSGATLHQNSYKPAQDTYIGPVVSKIFSAQTDRHPVTLCKDNYRLDWLHIHIVIIPNSFPLFQA